ENKIGKIFEPYYTTKENGTGLGLTLSYKIVKEHGGDITVRSKQGTGSQFTITLPVPQKERRMISTETDQSQPDPLMSGFIDPEAGYQGFSS
ncbi:MAG: ATP-binding protein, partial [Spirochaetia bacterium]|nr:ATP-binding protein [Spirochaetia bacterium]